MKIRIYLILRIAFSLLAAALLAAAVFVFAYLGWQWGLACLFAAAACAGLMLFFANLHKKLDPDERPAAKGDFISGPAHMRGDEEENNGGE